MRGYIIARLQMPDPALPEDSREAEAHLILYIIADLDAFDEAMLAKGLDGGDCVENLIVNTALKGFLLGKITPAPKHPWPGAGMQDRGKFYAFGFISSEAMPVCLLVRKTTLYMKVCADPECSCEIRYRELPRGGWMAYRVHVSVEENPLDPSKWILPTLPSLGKADAHPSWLRTDGELNEIVHQSGIAGVFVIPRDEEQKAAMLAASPKAKIAAAEAAGLPMYVLLTQSPA